MTMTDEAVQAWQTMGLNRDLRMQRIIDFANMLERRVSELDPNYRAYQFGRVQSKSEGSQS